MRKLPIGLADFKEVNTQNWVYIDKTREIYKMIESGKNFFLSRPRRFGKSLTLSTLYYYFKGDKEAFKGTWLYDHGEFKEQPVIRLDMSLVNCNSIENLRKGLCWIVKRNFDDYGLKPQTDDYISMLDDLIRQLSRRGPVAALVDEYDRPMLKYVGEPEKAAEMRDVVRDFYSVLKADEGMLNFAFLTGLTKITKAGIFSSLNQLNEISNNTNYATIVGCTQEELESSFSDWLDRGVEEMGVSREELLEKIKYHYNGFSFDGRHFVYNPFSLHKFFGEYEFKNFWIDSGMSDSLAKYAKNHDINPEKYLQTYLEESALSAYEIESAPPASFLAQSGYLTFKSYNDYLGYLLDYPNKEVKDSFSGLITLYAYNFQREANSEMKLNIITALEDRDFEPVFEAMKQAISNVPGKYFPTGDAKNEKKEYFYHTIILTLLWSCGLDVKAEEWTSKGISDLVLNYRGDIYVIELKLAPPEVSLKQIHDKGYADKYASAPNLRLIGMEINDKERTLAAWKQEP
ncbi:MAG: ATP-binding protein [Spirochaetaceae bacterium]|jgi:hypothetical protein|nr:ATP-binding protein [Spirochaetaceae bacterium]